MAEQIRVQVLMSTWNGEKFLSEQIDSILAQKDVEVSLLIRDDGSSDGTPELLKHPGSPQVRVTWGENLGYKASFITLLKGAGRDFDYYAFADQDDVWLADKLITAIRRMEAFKGPAAYCSNPIYVNKALEPVSTCHSNLDDLPDGAVDPRWAIATGLYGLGCTFVWNREMMIRLREGIGEISEFPFAHDNFISVAAPLLGTLIKDREGKILYRQHEKNTSPSKEQKAAGVQSVLNAMASQDGEGYALRKYILDHYRGDISPDKQKILEDSLRYVHSFPTWVRMLVHSYAKGLNGHEKKKYYYRILTRTL